MKSTISKIFLVSLFTFTVYAAQAPAQGKRLECTLGLIAPSNKSGLCKFQSADGVVTTILKDAPWSFILAAASKKVHLHYDDKTDTTRICSDNPKFLKARTEEKAQVPLVIK